jgi:hypothetical protein
MRQIEAFVDYVCAGFAGESAGNDEFSLVF